MVGELAFKDEAAAEYDRAFAHVTAHFMPFLLRAAHVAPGMHVLDIATGTGLSAEAALAAVGPTGHVTAADVSPAMAEKARERLGKAPNASVFVEDGQALSFADCSFDVVLCNLGLMFFPDPVRGLSEFRRVLRPGGRVAVSVNTVVERSYNHQINENYRPTYAKSGRRRRAHVRARRRVAPAVSVRSGRPGRLRDRYRKAHLRAAFIRCLLRPVRTRRGFHWPGTCGAAGGGTPGAGGGSAA